MTLPPQPSARPVPYIEVSGNPGAPLELRFKSTRIKLHHQVSPPGGVSGYDEPERLYSEERPLVFRHESRIPVIATVRELIQPLKTVTREIRPVEETLETVLPRARPELKGEYKGQEDVSMVPGSQNDAFMSQNDAFMRQN